MSDDFVTALAMDQYTKTDDDGVDDGTVEQDGDPAYKQEDWPDPVDFLANADLTGTPKSLTQKPLVRLDVV